MICCVLLASIVQRVVTCDHAAYRVIFHGVLIFVIFVVHPGVTKFSTHEKFSTHCVVLSTCAQIWTGDVLLWLFFATCSTLDPPSPLSQALPCVRAEEVNREV